jgi:hypothetical protein
MNCVICHAEAHFKFKLKNYSLLQCDKCFHQWIAEKDSIDLRNFYDEDYFMGKKASFEASFSRWAVEKTLKKNRVTFDVANIFRGKDLSKTHILEIGPGPEENLFRYYSAFASIECFDTSSIVNNFLENAGAKVYRDWDDIPVGKYDAVTAYEVIEHEPDVLSLCSRVFSKIKKGGVFILTTGNTMSLYSRIRGENWYYYDPPAHLNYFSDKSMRILLRDVGFDHVKIMHIGHTSKQILSQSKLFLLFLPLFTVISSSMTVYGHKS